MVRRSLCLIPIDLIPDFIPVLGYLDDLLIVPLGIALAIRLTPATVMAEFRHDVRASADRPRSLMVAWLIVSAWLIAAGGAALWVWVRFR